jgi:hypothetical protein
VIEVAASLAKSSMHRAKERQGDKPGGHARPGPGSASPGCIPNDPGRSWAVRYRNSTCSYKYL